MPTKTLERDNQKRSLHVWSSVLPWPTRVLKCQCQRCAVVLRECSSTSKQPLATPQRPALRHSRSVTTSR
eukprot:6180640-Pleurochrysis_carterae.AAC.2